MPLQIFPKDSVFRHDQTARSLVEHIRDNASWLQLDDALMFCNFPLFREEGELLAARIVLLSPVHGLLILSPLDGSIEDCNAKLDAVFAQIYSRLIKYPLLRATRTTLRFNVEAILWLPEQQLGTIAQNDTTITIGFSALAAKIREHASTESIDDTTFSELISVLDGSKALIRLPERNAVNYLPDSKVAQIKQLEHEIRRFDREQRIGYMTEVSGTQRVRGLAGSGKTVVLAMKAAMTAIRYPEANIAFTFYTKSLYQHVKQLITRFYRLYEDRDPDWNRIRILHAWGGAIAEGFYSYAAKLSGTNPLTFADAQAFDPGKPFAFACRQLLETSKPGKIFDYVFVDEAQDFPQEFLRLALSVAVEDRVVIAYDVLQTIFDVETPTASSLFGVDEDGNAAVSFDEDLVLHKCYRNPREVLICAHAVGFGIYGDKMVQALESKEHWQDFGYQVTSGELTSGSEITITRSAENSPSSISNSNSVDNLVLTRSFKQPSEEVEFVATSIQNDIKDDGVSPEDILVICTDDRNAKRYFQLLTEMLRIASIGVHNMQLDNYGLRDFQSAGKVTLSTVYKAKGNEAYVVYVLGIDALFARPNARQRNIAFTAMTRAKGWLRVTGVGAGATAFGSEIAKAKEHLPDLKFTYPSPEQLLVMKRDLSRAEVADVDEHFSEWIDGLSDDDAETVLSNKLRELRARKQTKRFSSPAARKHNV